MRSEAAYHRIRRLEPHQPSSEHAFGALGRTPPSKAYKAARPPVTRCSRLYWLVGSLSANSPAPATSCRPVHIRWSKGAITVAPRTTTKTTTSGSSRKPALQESGAGEYTADTATCAENHVTAGAPCGARPANHHQRCCLLPEGQRRRPAVQWHYQVDDDPPGQRLRLQPALRRIRREPRGEGQRVHLLRRRRCHLPALRTESRMHPRNSHCRHSVHRGSRNTNRNPT